MREWIYRAGFVVVIAGAFLLLDIYRTAVPYAEAHSIGIGITSFEDIASRFENLAEEKGGTYAYEVLKRAELPPKLDLHLLGHRVGDILYEQEGIGGIANCTQDFRNACSHTIVIGALDEYGATDGTLMLIDDACRKAPGGPGAYTMCYHGLGHGVFAYFGYELGATVDFCKKMGTEEYNDEQYTQCVGGAIMELMGGGGHDNEKWLEARLRYLKADTPLAPCDQTFIPKAAKSYCYIYLTPRLFELAGMNLNRPDPTYFAKALSFCDALPSDNTTDRNSCFGGFGKEFVVFAGGRDAQLFEAYGTKEFTQITGWCDSALATDGVRACILQVLESLFWGGENDPAVSVRYCSVQVKFAADCYEKLSELIGRYLPERAGVLCEQLPQEYRQECLAV